MRKNSSLRQNATDDRTTAIAIGGVTVQVNTSDPEFVRMLEERYAGFIGSGQAPDYEFDIELAPPADNDPDADVRVYRQGGKWRLERGDFRAEWDPVSRRKKSHQTHGTANRPRLWGKHAVEAALGNPQRKLLRAWATREAAAVMVQLGAGVVVMLGVWLMADVPLGTTRGADLERSASRGAVWSHVAIDH